MPDPTQITQQQVGFAPEVAPYAQDLLGRASAMMDLPYQEYAPSEQVAQFSPLQQQSYDYATQLKSAPQLQDATALAGLAGLSALNTGYTYNPLNAQSFTDTGVSSKYMSPYMQDVVNVQQQQAKRQADIAAQTQQAQAARSGAFGGGRDAIMRSQANAELQRNLQGIQATGLQNAYQQGMQQFNQEQQQRQAAAQLNAQQGQFGASLGMQGLQTALQGAGQLGNLGQTQYAQNVGLIGLQNQLGLQQQQQAQNLLNVKYQNWLAEQNMPYKQMGFMSDILRGAPLTTTGSTVYQAAPSAIQNLTSLGLGAYGLSSLFGGQGAGQAGKAAGGSIKGYAGGGSVTSREFKEYAVDNIPSQLLPIVQRNAQARNDRDTYMAAIDKMAEDAAIRRGIAGALPAGVDVVRAAGGGIVAFGGGGKTSFEELLEKGLTPSRTYDKAQAAQEQADYLKETRRELGPDPTVALMDELAAERRQYKGGLSAEDKGLIALQMAGAMVDPSVGRNFMRGLGSAARVAGSTASQIKSEKAKANRDLMMSEISGRNAQRAAAAGELRDARMYAQQQQALRQSAEQHDRSAAIQLSGVLSQREVGMGRNAAALAAAKARGNPMAPIIKGMQNVEALAQRAAKDYMANPKNVTADYDAVLQKYRTIYGKQLGATAGFGPTGKTYDTDEDEE